MTATYDLIKAYAKRALEEDEADVPLIHAILDSQCPGETEALGIALLCRNEALADPPCQYGGKYYARDLAEIAERLNWKSLGV